MIALVLDVASSTGYCLVKITTINVTIIHETETEVVATPTRADIFEYGTLHVKRSSPHFADHCLDLSHQVEQMIDRHHITHIAMEDYFFTKKNTNNCKLNISLRTAVAMLARQKGVECTMLNIVLWKRFVSRCSHPTKEQLATWGRNASKIFIQDALWKNFGIRFPKYFTPPTSGRPTKFSHDIIDAVGQAIYYCCKFHGIHERSITCSVPLPPDMPSKAKFQKYSYQ